LDKRLFSNQLKLRDIPEFYQIQNIIYINDYFSLDLSLIFFVMTSNKEEVDEMYEGNTISQHYNFDGLENQMEGAHRPGHFDGVGTVVKKLFDIVKPTNAYFGEKDFQQLQIVKKLVEKNNMPINIVGCPISREPSGLAMSSRNRYLNTDERKRAAAFPAALSTAARENDPGKSIAKATALVTEGTGSAPQYVELVDAETLAPLAALDRPAVLAAAVKIGETRLIDNVRLAPRHAKV
jgi:pantoate--beta-alanine ligase